MLMQEVRLIIELELELAASSGMINCQHQHIFPMHDTDVSYGIPDYSRQVQLLSQQLTVAPCSLPRQGCGTSAASSAACHD